METLSYLGQGFQTALSWQPLLYCFIGCLWGTIVGVLPGLGPLAGMSLLLPLTFHLDPASGIIMLAGIFYGAMYGGSITSILVRIPGEAASVVTCIDGYEMARQGRAGPALVVSAVGSFIGGTLSIVGLMFFAPPLSEAMLKVGPAAEFILMMFSLFLLCLLSSGPFIKTFCMIILGLMIGMVGLDPITVWPRYSFGFIELYEGIDFVPVAIGLLGVSEILMNLQRLQTLKPIRPRLSELLPKLSDMRRSMPSIGRGSLVGFLFGIMPGAGHIMSTFVSYALEKRISKRPEEFGKGAIEGVAGPETANNATTGAAMMPLLILGIPTIPSTALLLSALLVHGVQAGPMLLTEHPDVFWGLVASMYIGNILLLILNLPLVGLFINLLRIPYSILAPAILIVCVIGVYSVSGRVLDVWLMAFFGLAGFFFRKFDFDMAPLVLALVLSENIELSFRRALMTSDGDFSIFFKGSAAQLFLIVLAIIMILQLVARFMGYRKSITNAAEKGDLTID
jgi:putative tricarboxylic transport membrane protein